MKEVQVCCMIGSSLGGGEDELRPYRQQRPVRTNLSSCLGLCHLAVHKILQLEVMHDEAPARLHAVLRTACDRLRFAEEALSNCFKHGLSCMAAESLSERPAIHPEAWKWINGAARLTCRDPVFRRSSVLINAQRRTALLLRIEHHTRLPYIREKPTAWRSNLTASELPSSSREVSQSNRQFAFCTYPISSSRIQAARESLSVL